RSEAKRPTERGRRSKSAQRSRILNGGHRREALGVGRLSRRRHSCPEGRPWVRNGSGVSQTRYRSDFKRTWVRLGERGRRDRLGARRGESLFSLIWIETVVPRSLQETPKLTGCPAR